MFQHLPFPKHQHHFNTLSQYIQTHTEFTLPISLFHHLYHHYTESLNF
ncbi:YozE family protein [Staphylococcus epidermidis]